MKELRRYDYVVQQLVGSLTIARHGYHTQGVSIPAVGDLVILRSAPATDWHLSFYVSQEGNDIHILESLKHGQLASWTNVGFFRVDPELCGISYSYKWTDEMFAFRDKFMQARVKLEVYSILPHLVSFDGDNAQIKFRRRWENELSEALSFPYKKVKLKALTEWLAYNMAAYEETTKPKPTKE